MKRNLVIASISGSVILDPCLIECFKIVFDFANAEGLRGVKADGVEFTQMIMGDDDRIYVTCDIHPTTK